MFFDLEGDAFEVDGGLEYLFGVADRDDNYNASWALDPASEKRAFERFIGVVMDRDWQLATLRGRLTRRLRETRVRSRLQSRR